LLRELKFGALAVVASLSLAFACYEILLSGSYLAGIGALSLAAIAVIFASIVLHVVHPRKVRVTEVRAVIVEMRSATSDSSGGGILFPAVAGSFAVIILFAVIANGEQQKQLAPAMSETLSTSDKPHCFSY
jgi:hypothetical protein